MEVPVLGQPQVADAPQEPEFATPELRQQWKSLGKLREENEQLIKKLAAHGASIDPFSVFQTRFSLLIEKLWPSDTQEGQTHQLGFELEYETTIREILKQAAANVVQAQLAQGANLAPGQLQQMAEAAGLVAPAAFRKN